MNIPDKLSFHVCLSMANRNMIMQFTSSTVREIKKKKRINRLNEKFFLEKKGKIVK